MLFWRGIIFFFPGFPSPSPLSCAKHHKMSRELTSLFFMARIFPPPYITIGSKCLASFGGRHSVSKPEHYNKGKHSRCPRIRSKPT